MKKSAKYNTKEAKKLIKEESAEVRGILGRFRRRDFSGNTGQAMKNSSYQLATNITAKIGSLIFTVIIARLLVPEIYGLYGLALSTILLFGVFSDFGVSTALLTFCSKTIDKNKPKSKAYFKYLTKIKIFLLFLTSMILILSSKWVANSYYNKPIFYALLAGAIYHPLLNFSFYLSNLFISKNNFKTNFKRELLTQVLRLIFIPIFIILFLDSLSKEIFLFYLFLILGAIYLIVLLFLLNNLRNFFDKAQEKKLSKKEKKDLNRFIFPLIVTALSGVFFGYIDIIMLGRFVSSEFIAYYQVSFNLVTSASAILGFSALAVFPIFSRLKQKRLENAFKKTKRFVLAISFSAFLFTLFVSKFLIQLIYGKNYLPATLYLQVFSVLLISFPLIELYISYYTSIKRTKIISYVLIVSTILNVVLNYIFIKIGLNYGMKWAVLGACVATIISRYIYLGGLVYYKK